MTWSTNPLTLLLLPLPLFAMVPPATSTVADSLMDVNDTDTPLPAPPQPAALWHLAHKSKLEKSVGASQPHLGTYFKHNSLILIPPTLASSSPSATFPLPSTLASPHLDHTPNTKKQSSQPMASFHPLESPLDIKTAKRSWLSLLLLHNSLPVAFSSLSWAPLHPGTLLIPTPQNQFTLLSEVDFQNLWLFFQLPMPLITPLPAITYPLR